MATVSYFIRTTKNADPNKKINVRIRFRDGRKINLYAKAGLEVLPNHFSKETHTINKRAKYAGKYNDKKYLDNLENFILEAFKELREPPSSKWLRDVIEQYRYPNKSKGNTLFEFIAQYIKEAPYTPRRSNDRLPSKKTLTDYNVTYTNLKEFARFKDKEDFGFDEINNVFYDDFKKYLTIRKGYALNTVGKKIKVLKTFLNEAEYRGLIDKAAYSHFKKLAEPKEAVYLNIKELEKIQALDLSGHLDKVRDLFLVGCWTGLRFSDWHKVKPENINNGFLTLNQQKTGQPVVIPLYPTVKTILDKYYGKLPKPLSNQKVNEYLKEIARLADFKEAITQQITKGGKVETGIKHKWELVTTHTARRSFATNMYKMGIPSITIMAITGHRTESAFLKYIKVTPQEHAEKMRDMWRRQGSHLKVSNDRY